MVVGTCYEDAWRFLIKQEEGFLVHGLVQLSAEGPRVYHAWVELPTGWVWEPQTKSYFTLKDFEITSPIEEHRYTGEEAAIMTARTGNMGPWTDEERQILKGNPDDKGGVVLTAQEGQEIARQLDLHYDGIQKGYKDIPDQYQFTDVAATGTTFYGNTLEKVKAKLIEKRQLFGAELPLWAKKELEGKKKAMEGVSKMAKPGTESIREKIFGKGAVSPLETLKRGMVVNNLMPMSPEEGPPLPKMFALRWPWKK